MSLAAPRLLPLALIASVLGAMAACGSGAVEPRAASAPSDPAASTRPAPTAEVRAGNAGEVGPENVAGAGASGAPADGSAGPRPAASGEPAGREAGEGTQGGEPSGPDTPGAQAKAAPPIPPSTAVLHVGDSMVPSLARALRPRFRALGVRYEMRFEQSTFTSTWAGRMDALVAATQPHLVIVTLGGNEIGSAQPEAQARFVRRIVSAIQGRPCVWVTPPLWREESGIFDVIQENAAPCRFFETDRFLTAPIERVGDGIHPTPAGGEVWGDAFWPWLMAERTGGEQPWALRVAPAEERAPRGRRGAPTFAGL